MEKYDLWINIYMLCFFILVIIAAWKPLLFISAACFLIFAMLLVGASKEENGKFKNK